MPESESHDSTMEHRWGERVALDIPVWLTARPFSVRAGRLTDLSASGAFIVSGCELRVLSRVQVVIDLARSRHPMAVVAAYVTRKPKDGIAVEWCEFAPPAILDLLRAPPRRHVSQPIAGAAANLDAAVNLDAAARYHLTRIRSGENTPA